jgi:hypothetical protein
VGLVGHHAQIAGTLLPQRAIEVVVAFLFGDIRRRVHLLVQREWTARSQPEEAERARDSHEQNQKKRKNAANDKAEH